VSAKLWSNPESTPIAASQDRGLREFYLNGTVAGHYGVHEWKAGADVSAGTLREEFAYTITDVDDFDSDVPTEFAFNDRRHDREQSLFVQDQIRRGRWTLNAGLRWDHYRLVVQDHAFSPRVALAWSPAPDLVFRASYDRAFQTPAIENLLLASTDEFERRGAETARLPVPTSRGNFFDAGLSKAIGGRARVDLAGYDRRISDTADDDLLLNTGVSFPIAFRYGNVYGAETNVELRQWKRLSGSIGYSYMRGIGELPVTGGLFLGEDDRKQLESSAHFALTQDQRHTIRGRAVYQVSTSSWMAIAGSYGSGLPFEDFEGTPEEAAEQFGQHVVERVNFETGRVRANASLDVSAGTTLAKSSRQALRLQAEVRNLTNRVDVINFAGLFSGTALAVPRSVSIRIRWDLQ
jgi:outer membrane receptor protein involved in Fe transport